MKSSLCFYKIEDAIELLNWIDFFMEGHKSLVERNLSDLSDHEFLVSLFKYIDLGDRGFIGLVTSKNNKPLAFCLASDFTQRKSYPEWLMGLAYHNQKDQSSILFAQYKFEEFCRGKGIKKYSMQTRRNSGAAVRCFEGKFKMKREALVFSKEI